MRGSTSNLPRSRSIGIKGPTPLTKIVLFPVQIAIDYMHLTCSGHCKTLIKYWSNLLLPHVFEQASNHLCSCILPHSFGYQLMSLIHFGNWKTKMFRYADDFTIDDRKIILIQGGTRPVWICLEDTLAMVGEMIEMMLAMRAKKFNGQSFSSKGETPVFLSRSTRYSNDC